MRQTAGKGTVRVEQEQENVPCYPLSGIPLIYRIVSAIAEKVENVFLGKLRDIEQCQSVLLTSSAI